MGGGCRGGESVKKRCRGCEQGTLRSGRREGAGNKKAVVRKKRWYGRKERQDVKRCCGRRCVRRRLTRNGKDIKKQRGEKPRCFFCDQYGLPSSANAVVAHKKHALASSTWSGGQHPLGERTRPSGQKVGIELVPSQPSPVSFFKTKATQNLPDFLYPELQVNVSVPPAQVAFSGQATHDPLLR